MVVEKTGLNRLEDFIRLAKQGQHIQLSIDLKKDIVISKINSKESGDQKTDSELYVLSGEFSFTLGENTKKVSKPYMYGISEEPVKIALREVQIANERLKMDYERLKNADIIFEEKYFS